jgi:hypothetical protein
VCGGVGIMRPKSSDYFTRQHLYARYAQKAQQVSNLLICQEIYRSSLEPSPALPPRMPSTAHGELFFLYLTCMVLYLLARGEALLRGIALRRGGGVAVVGRVIGVSPPSIFLRYGF